MNWTNVRLILSREVRDQLRDRRTLFLIAILPLVLYPLMGVSFLQVAQFTSEHPTRVLVFGRSELPGQPPLLDGDRFSPSLFSNPGRADLLAVEDAETALGRSGSPEELLQRAGEQLRAGECEAVIAFPAGFADRLDLFRQSLETPNGDPAGASQPFPGPHIEYSAASERSRITYDRLMEVMEAWQKQIGKENLALGGVPETALAPFDVQTTDLANAGQRDSAMWAKILPFLLLIWSLTGAFYPAIDLCAGEKERGTLETLLSSPAERSEIVWGKLLTVMLFSAATAVLNLISMGITGSLILNQLPRDMGPPPWTAPLWLLLALPAVSALFGALCLALAAFARSTKEGQYYLMPLILVTMPLVVLPMSPSVELTLGNSLVPVTGIVLLLRTLLEGNYAHALRFVPPVLLVTLTCCYLAIRWAVEQFNRESVLFRESERLDLVLWIKSLLRDRGATPSVAEAVFCGVVILVVRFFLSFAAAPPSDFNDFVLLAVATQLAVIAAPTLIMTLMLTKSPRQTLLLRWPAWKSLPAAGLLAVALAPWVQLASQAVNWLYPINPQLAAELSRMMGSEQNLGLLLLVAACLPAVLEELAFRGFILSGLRHTGRTWRAIIVTAILFGATHSLFQQSIVAAVLGLVLGYLAVQTGSLLPCVLFHFVNNALGILASRITAGMLEEWPVLSWVFAMDADGSFVYRWPALALGAATSVLLLGWFRRIPHERMPEEAFEESLSQPVGESSQVGSECLDRAY
jgi:sodium transport system permease protein